MTEEKLALRFSVNLMNGLVKQLLSYVIDESAPGTLSHSLLKLQPVAAHARVNWAISGFLFEILDPLTPWLVRLLGFFV